MAKKSRQGLGRTGILDYSRRAVVFLRLILLAGLVLGGPGSLGNALAAEPRSVSEPDVLREPGQFTDVADGLDREGQFDLRVTLSYQQEVERAKLLREQRLPAESFGAIVARPIASIVESVSRLELGAEIGLYRDVALRVRLPVILAHTQDTEGRLPDTEQSRALWGGPNAPLFSLPFRSPIRGGAEYLALGADVGVFNQFRDPGYPTIVVGGEVRLSITEPMRACQEGQNCWDPSVQNRLPSPTAKMSQTTTEQPESQPGRTRAAGIGRGTTGLEAHMRASQRFQWLEPYVGFAALLETPNDNSEFSEHESPPWHGTLDFGVEGVPWEVAEHFQRLSLDLRLTGVYTSRGQDYSELFDALGSSTAASYRQALPSVDPASTEAYVTGLTQVEAHGKYRVSLQTHWRVGRYVRFDVGGALTATQKHVLTLGGSGQRYRQETDVPGQRFLVDTSRNFSGWVRSTVLF